MMPYRMLLTCVSDLYFFNVESHKEETERDALKLINPTNTLNIFFLKKALQHTYLTAAPEWPWC